MTKANATVKGIIVGMLVCGILGFGAFYDVAFYDLVRHINFGNYPWNVIGWLSPSVLVIIDGIFLGISIARQDKRLKRITIISTIILTILIFSVFAYEVWYRFSLPETVIFQYS